MTTNQNKKPKSLAKGVARGLGILVLGGAIGYGVVKCASCAYEYGKEHAREPVIVSKEVCYDKKTGEEVKLYPLDYQQIQSRAGRNYDGLWEDLECELVREER